MLWFVKSDCTTCMVAGQERKKESKRERERERERERVKHTNTYFCIFVFYSLPQFLLNIPKTSCPE